MVKEMQDTFSIRIIEQGWITETEEAALVDLCSHGQLELTLSGISVVPIDTSHGISESALALLRTLTNDHTTEKPLSERIVFHGCGLLLMMGCPIGANFSVKHIGDKVHIDDVRYYPSTNENHVVRYPEANTIVEFDVYRREIVSFAKDVKAFFAKEPDKDFAQGGDEEYDRQQYREFWSEYNALLARFS